MPFNHIAVYGHLGWASSVIVKALIRSGAPIRVLHRAGSDISSLPSSVSTVEVDLSKEDDVVKALDGVDIVISLVGQQGVFQQYFLATAILKTNVKLFVPSNPGFGLDEEGERVPVMAAKVAVEVATRQLGIPMALILPGMFAESSMSRTLIVVDIEGNKITFSGNSEHESANLCTRDHVAAAYAELFASTPVEQLQGRTFRLCELHPSGREIADALKRRYGAPPVVRRDLIEWINREPEAKLEAGAPFSMI